MHLSRRTCFAVVARVTINTVTRVSVHAVCTLPTILTWVAGTFVLVCEMVIKYSYAFHVLCGMLDNPIVIYYL